MQPCECLLPQLAATKCKVLVFLQVAARLLSGSIAEGCSNFRSRLSGLLRMGSLAAVPAAPAQQSTTVSIEADQAAEYREYVARVRLLCALCPVQPMEL